MLFKRFLEKSEGAMNAMKPDGGKLNAVVRRVDPIGFLG
jgi:hypothetical protein